MRHGRLTLIVRTVATALLLLLAVPAVSSAEAFIGTMKVTGGCQSSPGAGTFVRAFSLNMEPGASFGQITVEGTGVTLDVTTDWIPNGTKGSYFSASSAVSGVGAFVYYGTIKGGKLKGYFAEHSYLGCVFTGKLKAATLQ